MKNVFGGGPLGLGARSARKMLVALPLLLLISLTSRRLGGPARRKYGTLYVCRKSLERFSSEAFPASQRNSSGKVPRET